MNALRPLSLGEMLDRGVTVFWRTALRALWLVAPAVAVSAICWIRIVTAPGGSTGEADSWLALASCVAIFASACPLVFLYGCAASNEPCTVKTAVLDGCARIPWAIAFAVLASIAATIAVAGVIFVFGFVRQAIDGFPAGPIANLVIVATTIAFVVAMLVAAGFLATFALVGFSACVFEGQNALTAFRSASVRCMWGRQWGRTCATGLAIVAPSGLAGFAGLVFAASLEGILPESWMPLVAAGAEVCGFFFAAMAIAIGLAWAVSFSLDARVRVEGLDLVGLADL